MLENNMYDYLMLMDNLPEKEVKIYKAVEELIKEGKDVASLRISEISTRAGIGKGTTYEYFTSKEELVYKAIHYLFFDSIKSILLITTEDRTFKEKFYSIMDYMWDNRIKEGHLQSLLRFIRNSDTSLTKELREKYGKEDFSCSAIKVMDDMLANFINLGLKEGIITETNDLYRKDVLCSQLVLFLFLLQDEKQSKSKEEIEDFVYNGLILLLNMNK